MVKGLYWRWRSWIHYWHGEIIILIELFKHPELPRAAKILIFSLLSYIFSPIDFIPDFIPLIGHLDDFIAIPIVLKLVTRVTPIELMERVREQVAADPRSSIFKSRATKIVAILIVFAWIGITFLFLAVIDVERYWLKLF